MRLLLAFLVALASTSALAGGTTFSAPSGAPYAAGAIEIPESAAPATPATGYVRIYAKSDGIVYMKDDAGTETAMGVAGGGSGDVVGPSSSTDNAIGVFPEQVDRSGVRRSYG